MPLTFAETGREFKVLKIAGKDDVCRRLADLGFVVGSPVSVVSELMGNLIVKVKDSRIAISREMAGKILV
ncbi:iron transporter FeoA [Spirochaetia bacterium]|nr:iron transporter FeoA [Spirochaetia bacterium]